VPYAACRPSGSRKRGKEIELWIVIVDRDCDCDRALKSEYPPEEQSTEGFLWNSVPNFSRAFNCCCAVDLVRCVFGFRSMNDIGQNGLPTILGIELSSDSSETFSQRPRGRGDLRDLEKNLLHMLTECSLVHMQTLAAILTAHPSALRWLIGCYRLAPMQCIAKSRSLSRSAIVNT
jgi:hypothetical protein